MPNERRDARVKLEVARPLKAQEMIPPFQPVGLLALAPTTRGSVRPELVVSIRGLGLREHQVMRAEQSRQLAVIGP